MENVQEEIEQQGNKINQQIKETMQPTTPTAETSTMDDKMNKKVGTKEQEGKLGPAIVKILEPRIEQVTVKNKTSEIIECQVKHPNKEDLIKISQVKYIKNSKVEQSGLWYHEDSDCLIVKNSALATFLKYVGVENVSGLTGIHVQAEPDKNGYLAFKAY